MAKRPEDHSGAHIAREAKVNRRHESNANNTRQEYVNRSNVTDEAYSYADHADGADRTGGDGKSSRRQFSPQKSAFSSAAQPRFDMGRRGNPRDDEGQPR